MTRALVTGAAGFVGANLARRLVADGHEVHLAVRPESRRWRIEELSQDASLHEVDLEDAESVARTVHEARPEWIFHLAARGAYSWQADVREILRANVIGTANLLEAAARGGFAAFVHAGTSSEYGSKDHAPDEEESVEPTSAYAVAKASATMLCRLAAHSRGNRVVVLRLYSVFGPWEEPGRLLPTLILRGLRNELPPLVSPDVAHDFVYVDDVSDAFLLAAGGEAVRPGAVFNVGSGTQTTLAEVVSVARRLLGIDAEPRWGSMDPRAWDTSVWIADIHRISGELGWVPRHSFEQGFSSQAEWFQSNPHLWPLYERLAEGRTPRG
jgi:dolichol-phosphate mannosyltransferase